MKLNDNFLSRLSFLNLALFIIFCGYVLYGVLGMNGFLHDHEGWAGPDLYSSAINLNISNGFLARTIDENHNVLIDYHHHPLLGFYIYNIVSNIAPDSFAQRLQYGYIFATLVLNIGWLLFYFFLRKLKYDRIVCLFVTSLLACSSYYVHQKALTNFDSLTCLTCSLLLFSYFTLIKSAESKDTSNYKIYFSWLMIFVSLNISLYFYAVNFVFAFIYIVHCYRNKYSIKKIILSIITPFLLITIVSISTILLGIYFHGNIDALINIIIADAGSYESISPDRRISVLDLLNRLHSRFTQNLNRFAFLFLLLISIARLLIKERLKNNLFKHIYVSAPFIFGGAIFVLLTRYWSVIHPFAFQIIVIGLLIIIANISNSAHLKVKLLVCILTIFVIFQGINQNKKIRKVDAYVSQSTSSLIKLVDDKFYGASFDFDNNYNCGVFNPGILWYISSYPNYTYNKKLNIGKRRIQVECIDPIKSKLKFYDIEAKKSYIVTYQEKEYAIINDN